MNKTELIKAVAAKTGASQAAAANCVAAVFDSITDAMKAGETVSLIGFGTFGTKTVAERTGRNPKTGEEIKIAAHTAPYFKAGKGLKDSVAE